MTQLIQDALQIAAKPIPIGRVRVPWDAIRRVVTGIAVMIPVRKYLIDDRFARLCRRVDSLGVVQEWKFEVIQWMRLFRMRNEESFLRKPEPFFPGL